jgi:hypothetical protein
MSLQRIGLVVLFFAFESCRGWLGGIVLLQLVSGEVWYIKL